jgi:hypothetical protein
MFLVVGVVVIYFLLLKFSWKGEKMNTCESIRICKGFYFVVK